MPTVTSPADQKLVLGNVPWEMYTKLLRTFESRRLRLTYDRGTLEIMTISFEHDCYGRFLGRLLITLTEEFNLPVRSGGSTTLRRRKKLKGLESDNCYWIQNEHLIRGKKRIILRVDPPPDVAIEIDITKSSLNRMRIYRALRVPEVWRFDGKVVTFHILQADGNFKSETQSRAFPGITPSDLLRFLEMFDQDEENAVIRTFRAWIRQQLGINKP